MANRRFINILAVIAIGMAARSQTLTLTNGVHTYYYPANTNEMTYTAGTTLQVEGKDFSLSEFATMKVISECPIEQNTVVVNYSGDNATVQIHGSVARYVDVAVSGATVTVTQSDAVSKTECGEITYILKGQSDNGSFTFNGSFKTTVIFNNLTLTNTAGAAVDIQCGKRIKIFAEGTNTLTDGAGSQKAALYSKGHIELQGNGTLTVQGNKGHAISAKEYITVSDLTIVVTGAVKDGINCNQYFEMSSGNVTISGTGDDGIQASFKDDTDREAEDTGSATISGGTININIAQGEASKGIKADGNILISGGDITINSSCQGVWDSEKVKTKASSCLNADGNVTVDNGTLQLTASGSGGKGVSCDSIFTLNGGTMTIKTTGGMLVYSNNSLNHNYTGSTDNIDSDYKSSAKGVKADGGLVINDGTITVSTASNNAEGLESKATMTINGGEVYVNAYDDGLNSSSDLTITGGKITILTTAGDAIDSNANLYISGGDIIALGAGGAEQGLDAADEDRCAVYITGGNVLSFGGRNAPISQTTGSQALVTTSGSLTAGTTVSVLSGSTTLTTFTIPTEYKQSSGGGRNFAPGGGGPGGGGSGKLQISCPGMTSGTSYTVKNNTSSTTAKASYTSSTW